MPVLGMRSLLTTNGRNSILGASSNGRNAIVGVREVQKLFEQVGKAPAKVLNKAVRKGGNVVMKAAKDNASKFENPTGSLRNNIVMRAERSKKGKKVYQIFVASHPHFVKISKAGKRSFYPASMEYGWTDQNGKYHPGYRYMRKAAEENAGIVKGLILEVMASELDRLR